MPKTDIAGTDDWIKKVYGATTREELKTLYDDWAGSYDAAMREVGYLHTAVIGGLLARHVLRNDAAILDAGAGTGANGELLSILGYNNVHGLDMSEAMLSVARSRKVYADLKSGILGEPLDYVDSSFDAIISTGTFTAGHAPASAFDELVRLLETGGVLIVTIGTVVFEEQGFREKLSTLVAAGILASVAATQPYRPMPLSKTESALSTRAYVYRKL
jgi:SAM-dependent methyltransferase